MLVKWYACALKVCPLLSLPAWPHKRLLKEKGHLGPLPAFFLPLPALASLLLLTDARVDSRSVQLLWATADSRPRLFPPQVGCRRARQQASAGRRLRFSRAPQLLGSSTSGRAPRVCSDRLRWRTRAMRAFDRCGESLHAHERRSMYCFVGRP